MNRLQKFDIIFNTDFDFYSFFYTKTVVYFQAEHKYLVKLTLFSFVSYFQYRIFVYFS